MAQTGSAEKFWCVLDRMQTSCDGLVPKAEGPMSGFFFFFQAEDGIRDYKVTGVQTCALPISEKSRRDELEATERRKLAFGIGAAFEEDRISPALAGHGELGADSHRRHAGNLDRKSVV